MRQIRRMTHNDVIKIIDNAGLLPAGTRIYYRGDMANPEDFGTIKRAYADKWGRFYDITLDDGRKIRALPAVMVETKDTGNGSVRFVTIDGYKAFRRSQLSEKSPFYQIALKQIDSIN